MKASAEAKGSSELLLLSIMELSWSQQSCSQPLQTAASLSILSWRRGHPSLNLAGVLLSLPAKDKAAEPTRSRVAGKVATPSKVWLNHPRLLLCLCHSKLGSAISPRLGSHRAGMVVRPDTGWAESRSWPCWVPAKDTIAGTQPVP